MTRIPRVKTWVITTKDGTKFEVFAPSRRLAKLNFASEIRMPIRSISVKRQENHASRLICEQCHKEFEVDDKQANCWHEAVLYCIECFNNIDTEGECI